MSARPGPVCNRCRQVQAVEGDSWCTGCTSWEALGRELSGHWDVSGCRVLATDLVLNCVRQVRALRSLGAGLARAEGPTTVTSSPGAGSRRASRYSDRGTPREPLPRSRASTPPPPVAKAEVSDLGEGEGPEGESEEEEEEGRSPTPDHRPIHSEQRRPPEPEGPPSGHHRQRQHRSEAGSGRASARDSERERSSRGYHGKRRGSRRGGRKHQRLHRLVADPRLRVHRKPPQEFWELSCLDLSRGGLDRPILQQ